MHKEEQSTGVNLDFSFGDKFYYSSQHRLSGGISISATEAVLKTKKKKIKPVKPEEIEMLANAALAWAYGLYYGMRDDRVARTQLLSWAGSFWLTFQKKRSGIEIEVNSPFEVAKKYVEDCKTAGYVHEKDSVSGSDELIKVEINRCFYRPLCLDLVKKKMFVDCLRLSVLENVIFRGSLQSCEPVIQVGEKVCKGTIKVETSDIETMDKEVESLFEATKKYA